MSRRQRIHLQNVRIAVGARRHHFDERVGVPFLCECDDESCHEFVIVTLPEHDRTSRNHLALCANGHTIADGVRVGRGDGYELFRVADAESATG